jgi:hypothetical protein
VLCCLQDSAIYCLGLYRGLLSLFGLPVNVNFANKVITPLQRGCAVTMLFKRCIVLLTHLAYVNSSC